MCTSKCWLTLGALLGGLAVAAGAYSAHGLDRPLYEKYADQSYERKVTVGGRELVISHVPLAQKYIADFKTGAEYQMFHALALLAVGLLAQHRPSRWLTLAGCLFLLGIVGFSGGLYATALTGQTWISRQITPLGGMSFIAAWLVFAVSALTCRREPKA